jgi:transcriptional regulator with XRE-family HTH domain
MLAPNLKYLRKKSHTSQQGIADQLGIPRTTYSEYEKGNTEPSLKMLIQMSKLHDVRIDQLLIEDLSHRDIEILRNRELKILATTVDDTGRRNIELVETKAEAGYLDSYADPEYISELPRISLPMASEGHYRAFEIHGDSMLPMESGNIIICRYLESLEQIKYGRTYIIITHKDGVVYKRLEKVAETDKILAVSDNTAYPPYLIQKTDVQEIWTYYAHVGFNDLKHTVDSLWQEKIDDIQQKVNEIYEQMNSGE